MNLYKLAKKRKTVRKFKEIVPEIKDIEYALKVAKEAPSGKNDQPWRFVLISEQTIKDSIRKICEDGERNFYENSNGKLKKWLEEKGFSYEKPFLSQAPYLLLVFSYIKSPFAKESVWLSIGYLLLALEEKGLSTVTYTPSSAKKVYELLKIPKDYKLESILPIGYSDDEKIKYDRKDLKEILWYESFQK